MPAKHPKKVLPESCTPEKRISGKHTRTPTPLFLQHRGGSVEAGRSTSPDEGRLSGKFSELFDVACLQWAN
ncbi:hypothetical protein AEQU_0147 [Adlercreutzia equolifaciens DSM 19450]|nr:hypothetical protein AEQU_0147 [Adlercreutzia equolifaciens DSM 19450]